MASLSKQTKLLKFIIIYFFFKSFLLLQQQQQQEKKKTFSALDININVLLMVTITINKKSFLIFMILKLVILLFK